MCCGTSRVAERYLLDTHCWLWWNSAPERLNPAAYAAIADGRNTLYFSAASGWEIAIKTALGKLRLPGDAESYVPRRLESNGIQVLPVGLRHALAVAGLPPLHRDPFDRLLVAQALAESLTLISADEALRQYDVKVI